MRKLYFHPLSGHAHRIRLFTSLIGLDVELVEVDLMKGEHKTEEFLRLNPFGQVPVFDDNQTIVSDSNSILVYLAKKYAPNWFPEDVESAVQIQRWFSVAAGELANGAAAARLVKVFGAGLDHERALQVGTRYLGLLNSHLENRDFLLGDSPTVADIALYSYTAHAPEGGLSLTEYTNVVDWLSRIEALPGFVGMTRTELAAH